MLLTSRAVIHLFEVRKHERVTNADRLIQECVERFRLGDKPKATHFIAASPVRPHWVVLCHVQSFQIVLQSSGQAVRLGKLDSYRT
jgi:hypothetical protein